MWGKNVLLSWTAMQQVAGTSTGHHFIHKDHPLIIFRQPTMGNNQWLTQSWQGPARGYSQAARL